MTERQSDQDSNFHLNSLAKSLIITDNVTIIKVTLFFAVYGVYIVDNPGLDVTVTTTYILDVSCTDNEPRTGTETLEVDVIPGDVITFTNLPGKFYPSKYNANIEHSNGTARSIYTSNQLNS